METKDPALTKTRLPPNQKTHDAETINDVNITHSADTEVSVNKGTETLKETFIDSEHVNKGDNPARQPDRRDQQGSTAFDDNINEDTVGSEAPKSQGITDSNRYATIDNAQTRTLAPDEKD